MYIFSISRKQDLRELKVLQKNENKQYQDLIYKSQMAREMQDRKFETDMQVIVCGWLCVGGGWEGAAREQTVPRPHLQVSDG